MPDEIKKHLTWIAAYCELANTDNYLDMLDNIERQIRRAQTWVATDK